MIYDLIVIGAGSGGVRSARIASTHGAKVAIIEGSKFGGTCVNLGCVPKKLFYYVSQFNKDLDNYASYGWSIKQKKLNWKKFIVITLRLQKNLKLTKNQSIGTFILCLHIKKLKGVLPFMLILLTYTKFYAKKL